MNHGPGRRYDRMERVNEVVQEVLADELTRLSDPRLELVTVTGVAVAGDLSRATVYWATAGGDPQGAAVALGSAASHLRGVLGRSVRLRQTPELRFEPDPAIATGQRIEEILRGIHERQDSR